MKVVINTCFGGFGLSDAAYEELIKLGVPVRKYVEQVRGEDGLYKEEPLNEGKVIFDRDLTESPSGLEKSMRALSGRYWESWVDEDRANPLLVQVVEKLGLEAWGKYSELRVVEIPDGVEFEIAEYDGLEHIAEKHRKWS